MQGDSKLLLMGIRGRGFVLDCLIEFWMFRATFPKFVIPIKIALLLGQADPMQRVRDC